MSPNGQKRSLLRAVPQLQALPRPLFARAESLVGGAFTEVHRHPWVQLSYAIRGVISVHTAQGSFVAPPQRAVWIPAGLDHEVRNETQTEMRSLYLTADSATASLGCHVLEITPLTRELIRAFTQMPPEYDEAGAQGRLVQVLLDQLNQARQLGLSLPMPHDARLRRLCEALQARPEQDTPLQAWAQHLGASEKTLSRLFRRETGLTFRAWRQRLRLLGALSPLERGEAVTTVALNAGYQSTSAFIAAFKEQFEVTPGEMFSR